MPGGLAEGLEAQVPQSGAFSQGPQGFRRAYQVWEPQFPAREHTMHQMERMMDSCYNKAAMGLVFGGLGGVAFGILLGVMPGAQMDTMEQSQKAERITGKPWSRERFSKKSRLYFGEPWSKAKGMGKTFASFSVLYGGSECVVEKLRGKHDLINATTGGAFTGAVMAARSGPGAMMGGAVFIGAFSFAIDYYMESYTRDELSTLGW